MDLSTEPDFHQKPILARCATVSFEIPQLCIIVKSEAAIADAVMQLIKLLKGDIIFMHFLLHFSYLNFIAS